MQGKICQCCNTCMQKNSVSERVESKDIGFWSLSDREGHGHKAVVYKSHFPPLRHPVVTETPADTLANKPHLLQRPSTLLFMPPQHGGSSDLNRDLRTISLGCVTHCQSIGRVERSHRIAFSFSDCWLFPSCGTSVPFSGGHRITVS